MLDTPFVTCGSSIIPGCTIQGLQISDKYNHASSEDLQILRYLHLYRKKWFKSFALLIKSKDVNDKYNLINSTSIQNERKEGAI